MIPSNVIPLNPDCKRKLEEELAWREYRTLAREEAIRRALPDLAAILHYCDAQDAMLVPARERVYPPIGLWPLG